MEVRNPETAAHVELRQRGPDFGRELRRKIEHIALRFGDRLGIERLAAGEDMQPAPFGSGRDQLACQSGNARGIEPERLGAAAHLHPRAAQFEIGVDPDREARRDADLFGDRQCAIELRFPIRG